MLRSTVFSVVIIGFSTTPSVLALVGPLHSSAYEYRLNGSFNSHDPIVYDTVALQNGERKPTALKCSTNNEEIDMEFDHLRSLRSETWARKAVEKFTEASTGLHCIASERLLQSFDILARQERGMDFSTIAQLGKRMLHITERLHKDYGLGHRAPGARTWMFRRRFTPDNTVLVGMHALRPLLMDPFGYHRIYELQQLVITLIYLGNPSVHQYALSKTSVADIDARCRFECIGCSRCAKRWSTTISCSQV